MNDPAVVMEQVSLIYRTGKNTITALDSISLSIEKGGITGILGPDTAGKTTLMRILAGLLVPDSGVVQIFGVDMAHLKKNNTIGYMPQRFGLYEDLTVAENLCLYAALSAVPENERHAIFDRLLDFTGLAPFTARMAGNLSGGMKQKLGIACALLGRPRLLLLDEPGVGVDPRSHRELRQMVNNLTDDGMTVLWATSYMDEAAQCPSLIVLEKGRLLFSGPPSTLARRAADSVHLLPAPASGSEKRDALARWSMAPGIVDVMIDGTFLRLETGGNDAEKATRQIIALGGKPTPPTLGDACLAAVGGIDKRPSPYAALPKLPPAANDDAKIVAEHLCKKFGRFTAVDNVSFKVAAGETVGLLGPNGAGKSTTFRMLCGLLRPTSGSSFVDGVNMQNAGSDARNRLGYMAQNFSLYVDISVWQNLSIAAGLYAVPKNEFRTFGREMAEALGLSPYLKSRTGDLSLGMKQRLSLLCATIHRPPVLFLDEPTSGVDIRTRREFWKHISALTNQGTAVLVTTHFLEEAEYCDNIALIHNGEMIKYGPPQDLKKRQNGPPYGSMEEAFIASMDEYDRRAQTHPPPVGHLAQGPHPVYKNS